MDRKNLFQSAWRTESLTTKTGARAYSFDDSIIYDELALPRSVRHLPTDTLLRDEAIAAFVRWREKDDKVEY